MCAAKSYVVGRHHVFNILSVVNSRIYGIVVMNRSKNNLEVNIILFLFLFVSLSYCHRNKVKHFISVDMYASIRYKRTG